MAQPVYLISSALVATGILPVPYKKANWAFFGSPFTKRDAFVRFYVGRFYCDDDSATPAWLYFAADRQDAGPTENHQRTYSHLVSTLYVGTSLIKKFR